MDKVHKSVTSEEYKNSASIGNHYTPKPKTENTLLLKLSLLQHKVTTTTAAAAATTTTTAYCNWTFTWWQ
jgi:hypothetical protein